MKRATYLKSAYEAATAAKKNAWRRRSWLAALGFCVAGTASAQEALQNEVDGQQAAVARARQLEENSQPDYTFKSGDFRLLLTPSVLGQWNDNVTLSKTDKWSDFIITPALDVKVSYPFGKRNLLAIDVTAGYGFYLHHSTLSSFVLNSDSHTGFSLDVGIKDVTLNLHNWISFTQGGNAQTAAIADAAKYGTFQNTAGLSADWNLNQAKLSAGYDRQNVMATHSDFNNVSRSADMFFIRPGVQVHPQILMGVEGTAALTRYDKNIMSDSEAYTVGPYVTFTMDEGFQVTARGGYTTYRMKQTGVLDTSSQNSWYAGLSLQHQILESLTYHVNLGREMSLGVQSDLMQSYYVRPGLTWGFIKGWQLGLELFYEHGRQGLGSTLLPPGPTLVPPVLLNESEKFDWYGGNLTLGHELSRRFSLEASYQLTKRSSDRVGLLNGSNGSYLQNLIGLQLTYHTR